MSHGSLLTSLDVTAGPPPADLAGSTDSMVVEIVLVWLGEATADEDEETRGGYASRL
jgi:hypothetical protein